MECQKSVILEILQQQIAQQINLYSKLIIFRLLTSYKNLSISMRQFQEMQIFW